MFEATDLNHLARKQSVAQHMYLFRKMVTMVVDVFFTKDVATLFDKPAGERSTSCDRLAALGITGRWRNTSTCPKWPQHLQDQANQALMLQCGHPQRLDSGLGQGPHYVRPKAIDKDAQPVWKMGGPRAALLQKL